MTATLPSTPTPHLHIISDTEWTQILSGIRAASNVQILNTNAVSATRSATTYGDLTGASLGFTKIFGSSGSDVGIMLFVAYRHGTASVVTGFGINDGTSDHDFITAINLTAGKHYYWHGAGKLTGLAAGAYTWQVRWKTASGTVTVDTSDTISMYAVELGK